MLGLGLCGRVVVLCRVIVGLLLLLVRVVVPLLVLFVIWQHH